MRNKINSIFIDTIKNDKNIIKIFSNTVLGITQNVLKDKELWLQINGDLRDVNTDDIDFMWYNQFNITNINNIEVKSKSDIDFYIDSDIKFSAKLRWGKGVGFSNLRVDLK